MAIDYMVMPMSQYLVGDYITPHMRLAWELGSDYVQITPDGTRKFPPNVSYGGPDAAERRAEAAEDVRKLLAPLFPKLPWDEDASVEPRFHRTDPKSLVRLEEHITAGAKRTWLDKLRGRSKGPPGLEHFFGTIFVPASVDRVVQIETPMHGIIASISTALSLLDKPCPADATYARDTLRSALEDAAELHVPMIIDG